MESSGDTNRAFLRLIFAASFASISYELALIRIFSISLWYHFAFMVISIAMLGIGASGTLLSVLPGLRDIRRLPSYALLLAIGIPASYLLANSVSFDPVQLSWDRFQLLAIGLYYVILSVPFLCFGMIVSTAYSNLLHIANAIYASDLTGAGAGALSPRASAGSPRIRGLHRSSRSSPPPAASASAIANAPIDAIGLGLRTLGIVVLHHSGTRRARGVRPGEAREPAWPPRRADGLGIGPRCRGRTLEARRPRPTGRPVEAPGRQGHGRARLESVREPVLDVDCSRGAS